MLIVAPTGSTKRVTLLSIPRFSSRQRKVTGRVPALEEEKTKMIILTLIIHYVCDYVALWMQNVNIYV